MKKILLGSMLLALVSTSCKKDDAKCDRNMANISGSYHLTSLKYKASSSSSEVDLYPLQDACQKDDVITLSANGVFTYTDAGVACSPNGTYSSTWSLSGNTVTIDGDASTITSFDCKTLVINKTDVGTGESSTITIVKN